MSRNQGYAWSMLALPLWAAGCNDAVALNEPITAEAQSLSRPCPPNTPKELAITDGSQLSLVADAEGAQVYFCKPDKADPTTLTWQFDHPDALLFGKNGRVIGHHYDGPTWEGLDNSTVSSDAKMATSAVVDPNSIAWLKLPGLAHTGEGIFSKVTWIQRLSTEGGKPPAGACMGTAPVRVPYTATYYFYTAASSGNHTHH